MLPVLVVALLALLLAPCTHGPNQRVGMERPMIAFSVFIAIAVPIIIVALYDEFTR